MAHLTLIHHDYCVGGAQPDSCDLRSTNRTQPQSQRVLLVNGQTHQSLSNSTRRLAPMRLSPAPPARADSRHTCRNDSFGSPHVLCSYTYITLASQVISVLSAFMI